MNKKFIYQNQIFDKKQLRKIILWSFTNYGIITVSTLVDALKDLGFFFATKAGLSLSLEDLKIPPEKVQILKEAYHLTEKFNTQVNRSELTEIERFQQVINNWNQTSEDLKDQVINYFKENDPLNPIYIMAFSGARGNISQVRQLVGMRGLMADPNGEIIDLPIVTNFREGLKITDYLISSFGARKGLVDTALKTADSGYLTRRLVDVAQDILIRESFCGTKRGIELYFFSSKFLNEQLAGRILAEDLNLTKKLFLKKGTELTFELIDELASFIPVKVYVFSSLTCNSVKAVCQKCYGWNLATNKLVRLGEAVGVLAAQSIGEPGTQLTMRTFHTGGVFTSFFENQIRAQSSGKILFSPFLNFEKFRTNLGKTAYKVLNKGEIFLRDYKNIVKTTSLESESIIFVDNLAFVKANSLIGQESIKEKTKAITTKELKSRNTGIVYLEEKYFRKYSKTNHESVTIWVFNGQLFNVPFSSYLKFQTGKNLLRKQFLVESKINQNFFKTSGIVKENKFSQNKLSVISEIDFLKQFKIKKYYKSKINYFIEIFELGLSISFITNNFSSSESLIRNIFLLEEKLYFFQNTYLLIYEKLNIKGIKNQLSKFSIIFSIKKEERLLKHFPSQKLFVSIFFIDQNFSRQISLKVFDFLQFKFLINFSNIILYPGESLFKDIKITKISLLRKLTKFDTNNIIFVIYPLEAFKIAKYKSAFVNLSYKERFCNQGNKIFYSLHPEFSLNIKNTSKQLLNSSLFKAKIFIKKEINKLKIVAQKKKNLEPRFTKGEKQNFYFLVEKKQLIEIGSILEIYGSTLKNGNYIETYKLTLKDDKKLVLFLTTDIDLATIYIEALTNLFFKKGDFIKKGDLISPNSIASISGQISYASKNKLIISKANSYLLSKGAFLFVSNEDFIEKDKNLGVFLFEKTTTGDIVQGLPKVEEILEARKISNKGRLIKDYGLFLNELNYFIKLRKSIKLNSTKKKQIVHFFQASFLTKKEIKVYRRLQSSIRNLEPGNFVKFNFLIKDGANLHKLLYNYYKYFTSFNNIYESCYRSLKKIQTLITASIQQVYKSQGVSISDKHVELIVRQMSSKVQVADPGKTLLYCGDILELESINYINNSVSYFNQIIATYIPILHGITRSSLKTDSFISAASFQETTKVLIDATIEGKIDWLKGLKENVIIGRLIPAGTGFNVYTNLNNERILPFLLKSKYSCKRS